MCGHDSWHFPSPTTQTFRCCVCVWIILGIYGGLAFAMLSPSTQIFGIQPYWKPTRRFMWKKCGSHPHHCIHFVLKSYGYRHVRNIWDKPVINIHNFQHTIKIWKSKVISKQHIFHFKMYMLKLINVFGKVSFQKTWTCSA